MLFKYSTTSSTQNEFDSLPRMPLILKRDNQKIEALGLVDSGATVNVLPHDIGLQLGGTWDDRKAIIQLAGNLGNQTAIPFTVTAYINTLANLRRFDCCRNIMNTTKGSKLGKNLG
jgi:hypothetical protein